MRKLSDPQADHPLAQIPSIQLPNPLQPYGVTDVQQNLQISGNTVGVHFSDAQASGIEAVVMFDWRSGFFDVVKHPHYAHGSD